MPNLVDHVHVFRTLYKQSQTLTFNLSTAVNGENRQSLTNTKIIVFSSSVPA